MDSVYLHSVPDPGPPPADDGLASANMQLLQGVSRLSQHWADHLSVDDPHRGGVIRIRNLADDLVRAGDCPAEAMTTARALLCTSCRRLNASHGRCAGQALQHCPLLNGGLP